MHGDAAGGAASPGLFVPPTMPDLVAASLGQASARAGVGLHQLRYVLAAAEHGGFRRAARHLGVQQSAVSRRIQELEDRLGAPIFERGPHGVRLTIAGEDFVRGAQGAVGELDLAVDRAADAARGDQAILRVGVLAGLGGGVLQELLRKLIEGEGGLAVQIVEDVARGLAARLAHGQLDVAFLLQVPARLETRLAWRERLLVAAPVEHRLADLRSLSWGELSGHRLIVAGSIGAVIEEVRGRRAGHASLSATDAAPTPASVARLVALGQGLGLVNEGDAARVTGVLYRPLARAFLTFHAVSGRRPEKPVLRRLMALLPG
ncbi:LysR family transcriptional regulator [Caulobacter segnis]|uniref:LysR family transcriptional regulator n=1 Tax=Caulobacter segnis TaxID=88688 RepID=UPI00285BD0D1|nr:LysR family transcriptional regulator [Caulobacter segnis]MDR6624452.1 DNA-binding transcriptional LysR family regulator [Caulobacter segnis]